MLMSAIEAMDERDYEAAERILRLACTQIAGPVEPYFEPPPPPFTAPKAILMLVLSAGCLFSIWGLWSLVSVLIWAIR